MGFPLEALLAILAIAVFIITTFLIKCLAKLKKNRR